MRRLNFFLLLICLLIPSIGCYDSQNGGQEAADRDSTRANSGLMSAEPITATPLKPVATSEGKTMFTQLDAMATGIDFQNKLLPEHMKNYLLNGAGVCLGDYDNDGLVDIYAVCKDGPNRLFRQVSPWKFEDLTVAAGNLGRRQLLGYRPLVCGRE